MLGWYEATGRALAFRSTADPYAILVSELMAQQTQAARASAAWTAWMARFPTVEALAAAPLSAVLRAWAGLGYNRRAVHLHRAAQLIVERHGGRVPDSLAELEALPGVGPYTARAVAALAFGRPVGAVDTNVRRVLGRICHGEPSRLRPAELQRLADAWVPSDRPGTWTHALMDLGARLCRPVHPRCEACPAMPWCRRAAGEPVPAPSAPAAGPGPARARPAPFHATRRWLRGRVLDRAREAEDGAWTAYTRPIGMHPLSAVRDAVLALAAEGLLEIRDGSDGREARLPGS